ncbi:MAG TPA: hypothetical protein VFU62_09285 [Hanamia sp.]|nr:hypothetical protein [Hanamia sp.]
MKLEMYIADILIDSAEVDFSFCDTLKKREDSVKDLQHYLYALNFDHAFVSRQQPTFFLIAESRVNEINNTLKETTYA